MLQHDHGLVFSVNGGLSVPRILLAFCLVLSMAASVVAQTESPGLDWVRLRVFEIAQRQPGDWNHAQIRAQLTALFMTVSADGKTVTEADLQVPAKIAQAQARSQAWSQLMIADLDGNGRVTKDNLRRVYRNQAATAPLNQALAQIDQRVDRMFQTYDLDRDGVITLEEVSRASQGQWNFAANAQSVRTALPLSLGKGNVLTLEDFQATVDTVLAEIDSDHDGLLSQAEVASYSKVIEGARRRENQALQERIRRQTEAAQLAASLQQCQFAPVPENVEFVVVAARTGRAVSTLSLGQPDESVGVADIVVAPGERPLVLLAWSQAPMIWRLRGATERVQSLMATSMAGDTNAVPGTAVEGLPAGKVALAERSGCLAAAWPGFDAMLDKAIPVLFKHFPDNVMRLDSAGVLTMSGASGYAQDDYPGRVTIDGDGPAGAIWQNFLDLFPAGLVHVGAEGVISGRRPVPYEQLPGLAGLAHLIEDGSLKVLSWGTQHRLEGSGPIVIGGGKLKGGTMTVQSVPTVVMATAKLRFPGSLPPGTIRTVIVAHGVPEPENPPQGVCMMAEANSGGDAAAPACPMK